MTYTDQLPEKHVWGGSLLRDLTKADLAVEEAVKGFKYIPKVSHRSINESYAQTKSCQFRKNHFCYFPSLQVPHAFAWRMLAKYSSASIRMSVFFSS
jgi:hypothetical protein